MRAQATTWRAWTSKPAQRAYNSCIGAPPSARPAWNPRRRNVQDALTGDAGATRYGARGTPGHTHLRARRHQATADLAASVRRRMYSVSCRKVCCRHVGHSLELVNAPTAHKRHDDSTRRRRNAVLVTHGRRPVQRLNSSEL